PSEIAKQERQSLDSANAGPADGSPRADRGPVRGTQQPIARDERVDVLLVTVTTVETRAVLEVFGQAARKSINGRIYFHFNPVNGARVSMTRCEMGSSGLGASMQAVEKGIAALSPAAVIMVGIGFGVSEEKQAVGDVLISESLRPYELQ